jgi:hypothetical protein
MEVIVRVIFIAKADHGIFETQQNTGIDIEGEVEVEWATAPIFWVEVDFPDLTERVGLDEMTFVVYVKPMIDRVILELGDIPGNIDSGHASRLVGTWLSKAG